MSRFHKIPDRAWEFAGDVGDRIRHAVPSNVGDRLIGALPTRAGGLLETGVALGAMKTGTRVAGSFLRRHPAVAVATVAGAGLLWYAARRKAQQSEHAAIEGRSRRIQPGQSGAPYETPNGKRDADAVSNVDGTRSGD